MITDLQRKLKAENESINMSKKKTMRIHRTLVYDRVWILLSVSFKSEGVIVTNGNSSDGSSKKF